MIYAMVIVFFLGADPAPESYLWVWYTDGCLPCNKQDIILKRWFAEKPMLDGQPIKYYKINLVHNRKLAKEWGVSAVPTIFVVVKGKVVYTIDNRDRFVGVTDAIKIENTFVRYGKLTKSANK